MTVVSTPPPSLPSPPRLPVRSRSAGPGVSPMLQRLAAERATGVLLRERGTLYLSDGEVVHAESPETPGLDVLLTTGGGLDTEVWREAVARAGERRRVGRFLVDSGQVSKGALELCHVGALFDAAYFVLGPSSAPARFQYGAAHWLGPVRPVRVAALERETLRRRELLHRIWSDPATDSAPLVRADRRAEPAIPARQEAVLGQVDGVRTAADISRALGRPAFHTLVDLRRLAAAGIVTTVPRTHRPTAPNHSLPGHTAPDDATPAQPTAAPTTAGRPAPAQPHPAATTPGSPPHPPITPAPVPHPAPNPAPSQAPTLTPALDPVSALLTQPSADPDIALLRRLRDALEAL